MTNKKDSIVLKNKTAVVLGVADEKSIAWAIAKALHASGAQTTVGYQQKFYSRVKPLLEACPGIHAMRCDLLNATELREFFQQFEPSGIDALIHSVAFGPASIFTEHPSEVNFLDFGETMEVSVHTLMRGIHQAKPFLNPWASVATLSFQASERAMPMYGLMGVAKAALESLVRYLSIELGPQKVRVNAISAGPVQTLAALSEIVAFQQDPAALERLRGQTITDLIKKNQSTASLSSVTRSDHASELGSAEECWRQIQESFAKNSPLPETITAEDVANTALFLMSDLSRKITGQVLHVDCGFGISSIF